MRQNIEALKQKGWHTVEEARNRAELTKNNARLRILDIGTQATLISLEGPLISVIASMEGEEYEISAQIQTKTQVAEVQCTGKTKDLETLIHGVIPALLKRVFLEPLENPNETRPIKA